MRRWLLAAALLGTLTAYWGRGQSPLPLLSYVARDDGAFAWEKIGEQKLPIGVTIHELNLTSQRWKDIPWTHTVLVAQPSRVTTSTAMLVISGGSIGSKGDEGTRLVMAGVAAQLQALVAVLLTVPNQPLFDGLVEDDLLAHTFVKVLETGDLEWAALLPMTKSAVKAMDAVQQFAEKELKVDLDGFVVTGASKRGWTTWLTAVADPKRVKGIAPMVYDNLNIPAQMRHQREVFGGYSEQIAEYSRRGLTDLADTEKARPLVELIDPYFYRDRLTMPKLIINGTNDRYWALDAANFYFDDLQGEKQILYVPNSGHGLEDKGRVLRALMAFFNGVAGRFNFPRLTWAWKEAKGEHGVKGAWELVVRSEPEPKQVLLWTAKAPTKDFRNAKWENRQLTASDRMYRCTLMAPQQGYAAAFAELVYESEGRDYSLCTTVRIVGNEKKGDR